MISIVTSYFNRKQQFLQTLYSISISEYSQYQVIVVDDGSDEQNRLQQDTKQYDFLKIIRIEPEDKWYCNPCVNFNRAVTVSIGDIIILQNPECFHVTDVISYTAKNLKDNYIVFPTYALGPDSYQLFRKGFRKKETIRKFIYSLPQISAVQNQNSWYHHPVYRNCNYHFCSAINRSLFLELGGFDQKYALGWGYDDNEFLFRLMNTNVRILSPPQQLVVHQYHNWTYQRANPKLLARNKALYQNLIRST